MRRPRIPVGLFPIIGFLTIGCVTSQDPSGEDGGSNPPAFDRDASLHHDDVHALMPYADWGRTVVDMDGSVDAAPDSGCVPDPFADRIASFSPGDGAGFGQDKLPEVVLGPPRGAGDLSGGTDVLSLGMGGEIVLEFTDNEILDRPGPDFIVFENAFYIGGDENQPFAEPGAVAVSEDGTAFYEYPCHAESFPYEGCAGVHPVYSNPSNGIDPTDPSVAGGDPFDLAEAGLTSARFIRIRDMRKGQNAPPWSGFDLDAVAAVTWRPACK